MDGYTITGIDAGTKAVYIHMQYKEHVLDDTAFVDDVTSADFITQAADAAYAKFQADIALPEAQVVLPSDVQSLIGQTVSAEAATVALTPDPVVATPDQL